MIVKDREFVLYLGEEKLKERCSTLAAEISMQYKHKNPLFLSILNGSFIFSSDLIRNFDFPMEISFIKLSSYERAQSTGKIQELIGLPRHIENRHVIVLEDIIDTGNTLEYIFKRIGELNVSSLSVAAMFLKPEIFQNKFNVPFVGFEIPDKFVVGYGLDYDGYGRNLKDLYQLKN